MIDGTKRNNGGNHDSKNDSNLEQIGRDDEAGSSVYSIVCSAVCGGGYFNGNRQNNCPVSDVGGSYVQVRYEVSWV